MKPLQIKRIPSLFKNIKWRKIYKQRVEICIALILVAAMCNLSIGCRNYFKVNSSEQASPEIIANLNDVGKTIIVHFGNQKWLLSDISVKNNTVNGLLNNYNMPPTVSPVNPDRPNRYLIKASKNQRYLLNEVHMYLDEYADLGNNIVSIPVNSINKIEIYDRDTATTIGSWFIGAVAGTAAFIGLLTIIIILTKESCPFIYSWNGEDYQFDGEIYSGSIHKPLERHDYLKLPTYSDTKSYTLMITNEVKEIQHTNLMELLVIDHPEKMNVLIDKNGKINTFEKTVLPTLALNQAGENVSELISSKDNLYYQSNPAKDKKPLKDYVVLGFPLKENAKSARLVIRAKNSVILDYTMGQFYDLFGSNYDNFVKKQQKASGSEMLQWTLDQGIPLSLYLERNGKWEFVDYYNIVGPMAFKDDVLPIPLNGNESNPLKLKLEFGTFLWEIDYAAVDYSPDSKVTTHIIPINTALNEEQKDVAALLRQDDEIYYIQPEMNNQAVVTFDLPKLSDQSRTIILHTKGWYQIIQDPEGDADIQYIKEFKKPNRFNEFIYEKLENVGRLISQP